MWVIVKPFGLILCKFALYSDVKCAFYHKTLPYGHGKRGRGQDDVEVWPAYKALLGPLQGKSRLLRDLRSIKSQQ